MSSTTNASKDAEEETSRHNSAKKKILSSDASDLEAEKKPASRNKKSQGSDGEFEYGKTSEELSRSRSKLRLKAKVTEKKDKRLAAVDSDDSDVKLEKEIESLEKMPKLSVKPQETE